MGVEVITDHDNDEDVADEAGDEDDGERDGNKEKSKSSDHVLILLVEINDLSGVGEAQSHLLKKFIMPVLTVGVSCCEWY